MKGQFIKTIAPTLLLLTCITFASAQEKERKALVIDALGKGISFLSNIQRADGAICDTSNALFDIWETVLAATALYQIKQDTNQPALKKALSFLRENENPSGLICHNKKCRNEFCLETTSVYYTLLFEIGERENVRKGAEGIAAMQKPTGQWAIGNPDISEQKEFPSVTAFVLNMLNKAGVAPPYKKENYTWLSDKQTLDGDWGHAWEYYNSPAYALWPMMKTLNNKSAEKEKALNYILSRQQKDGGWSLNDSFIKRTISPELHTALMLSALYNAGFNNKKVIDKGIDFLLSKQSEKGCWDGGYFPIPVDRYIKKEYVFATALSMSVLISYLHSHLN